MKVRLTAPGFETYTGHFGVIEFKDGLSVEDVPPQEIDRLAANIAITDEQGNPLGLADRIVGAYRDTAPNLGRLSTAAELKLPPEPPVREEPSATKAPAPRLYTEAELAQLADAKGIRGLREVGDAWGVKGRAIDELMSGILKAQDKFCDARGLDRSHRQAPAPTDVIVEGVGEEN
jgi:hypothetical protein